MSASPIEAEATGQEFISVTFSGIPFRVPLDVDSWPLDAICRSRMQVEAKVVVNHYNSVNALRELLGDQWDLFLSVAPLRRQVVAAAQAFAAGVGLPADLDTDIIFGAVPRIVGLLNEWPREVESDLDRFWDIDYRDRWLFTAGRRRLTIRQIYARLGSKLPSDGALLAAINGGSTPLSDTAIAVMDLQERLSGVRHPARPMPQEKKQERDQQQAAEDQARVKYRERMKTRQEAGLETARANARISQRGNACAEDQA